MSNFTLIMFLIGCLGFVVTGIITFIKAISKKECKKELKLTGIFIVVIIAAIALKPAQKPGKVASNSNSTITKSEPKKEEPKKEDKKEISGKVESNKTQADNKKVDKNGLKKQIDSIVLEDLKGKSYSLDILTPTKNADKGYIVSIQVDNKKFLDESNCKQYTKDFLLKLKDIEGVQSIDMNFISESKLVYGFRIDDFPGIKNKDNVLEDIEFQKF